MSGWRPLTPELDRALAATHQQFETRVADLVGEMCGPSEPAQAWRALGTAFRRYYFLPDPRQGQRPRAAGFNVEAVRWDFPALHQQMNGRPLIYLDNGATTHKPRAVIEATTRFYAVVNSNIHRGGHALDRRATEEYEAARARVAQFIHAADPSEIVFLRGATEAVNLVAYSYALPRLESGDEVLITQMEHHSNLIPWQRVCEASGATLRFAPVDDRGDVILEQFEALLGPRTKIAAVAHVSNALGTVNPVKTLIDLAHARNVPILLDGAQAAPHLAVDVQALGCDFYALSGHKLYGPTGIGVLYARAELLESMEPYQTGGGVVSAVTEERATFLPPPLRFEAGTANLAGAVGLRAALDYLDTIGFAQAIEHEARVTEHARTRLASVPGLRLVGHPREHLSLVSFVIDGVSNEAVDAHLDQRGIAVRVGYHCAMPLMARLGLTEGTVRPAIGLYNTIDEIEQLAAALEELVAHR